MINQKNIEKSFAIMYTFINKPATPLSLRAYAHFGLVFCLPGIFNARI